MRVPDAQPPREPRAAQRRAHQVQQGTVRLEFFAWLNRELGSGTEGTSTREVPLVGDGSVRALLRHLAGESARFRELVYDAAVDRVREYVALIVNGQAVELAGGLDRRLQPGDHLLLVPGFSGG